MDTLIALDTPVGCSQGYNTRRKVKLIIRTKKQSSLGSGDTAHRRTCEAVEFHNQHGFAGCRFLTPISSTRGNKSP